MRADWTASGKTPSKLLEMSIMTSMAEDKNQDEEAGWV